MNKKQTKERMIDKIAKMIFWVSLPLLVIIGLVPLKNEIRYIISPIMITLWGISLVMIILSGFWDFKIKDYDYFRNVLIGIFGGLTVWFFSTIDFSFSNGIMLGINNILIKLGFGVLILVLGYKLLRKNN